MTESTHPGGLGASIARTVRKRLKTVGPALAQVLVAQAKRRISAGGDSTHRYPDLWGHPGSYRAGGQPLRNTGQLMNGLHGDSSETATGVSVRLVSAHLHAQYHQSGFSTSGPNFIPLNRKAVRLHKEWSRQIKALSAIKRQQKRQRGTSKVLGAMAAERKQQADLVLTEGEDYIMAWRGVTVPQRKIFNMPPEDVEEFRAEAARAVLGV